MKNHLINYMIMVLKMLYRKLIKLEYLVVFICLFCFNLSSAQLNPTFVEDAISLGGDCYRITNAINNQRGAVWYENTIDFNSDFDMIFDLNMGSNDANGADGIVLVFKTSSTPEVGNSGGGLAYQGINNNLAIEFDTWQNGENGDPFSDHIALISNGNVSHTSPTNLAGPINASLTSNNIEDGQFHEVKVLWRANTQTLSVFFDCDERIIYSQDFVNTIFGGTSDIYFGFVGSTGGAVNVQQLCFKRLTFIDDFFLEDQSICNGTTLDSVDATYEGAVSYSWSPTTGISNPNIPNPTFSPTTNTTYTVTITDECGEIITEDFTINILPIETPVFDAINPICEGESLDPLPGTSNNGITGSWSPALNNMVTTTYTFTPDNDQCASSTTLEIVVNPLDDATFDVTPTCDGATVNNPLATPGGVFEFTGFPGVGVNIDPATGEVTGAISGLPYVVQYTTAGACPDVFTLTFTVLIQDDPSFTVTPTCDGGTVTITGDTGGIFS
ncbi:L-type lectin-domain containing protein, partial [uncultured Winogradskyella sp.]|uniref:L-type lectin-domain containing protein n=1 Tax=uncultured Winogradskyella sp. TaxID=395353 RepID=UPI002603D9EA